MPMYAPTFLSPDNIGIDATLNNTFTWQPGGDQVAFQLYIYNNANNTQVYDSTKITSSISSHEVPADTLTNGNEYKWFVRTYWDETNYVDSDWVLFKANSFPTITLTVPTTIETQNYTFVGTYSQAEGILVKKFKFVLYDNDDEVLRETDWVYSQTVQYEITGLLNNTIYKIQCFVVDQNEMEAESPVYSFTTDYDIPDDISELVIIPLNDIGSIKLDWTNIKQILGNVQGDYEFIQGIEKGFITEEDFRTGESINLNYLVDGGLKYTYSSKTWNDYLNMKWSDF